MRSSETLFSKTEHYSEMFDMLWTKYGNVGFYVNICKPTLRTKRSLPDTLQDMCHPAIADSRIMYFDDKAVAFITLIQKTKRKIDVVMKIEDFMLACITRSSILQYKVVR